MLLYVDASFVAKLLVDEAESAETAQIVDKALENDHRIVSSRLVVTELHRLAFRTGVRRLDVNAVLGVLTIINPDADIFLNAGLIPYEVKTLDAIHIATALKMDAGRFLTYDRQQRMAAESMGLRTDEG